MENMFCFQCEQTAGCTGCTGNTGVCGKTADVAALQDELTGALIGLARVMKRSAGVDTPVGLTRTTNGGAGTSSSQAVIRDAAAGTYRLIIEGLFTAVTNVNFNE